MSTAQVEKVKIKVTLNYNGNMEKLHNVPVKMSDKEINSALEKKYGIYDIKSWVRLSE